MEGDCTFLEQFQLVVFHNLLPFWHNQCRGHSSVIDPGDQEVQRQREESEGQRWFGEGGRVDTD